MKELFHRTSIRKFTAEPVAREDLLAILRAGMQAPSATNQQPWEFYVVTDRQTLRFPLRRFHRGRSGGDRLLLPHGRARAAVLRDRLRDLHGKHLARHRQSWTRRHLDRYCAAR